MQNLNAPSVIFGVCEQHAISNEMLGEIVSYGLGATISANDVAGFFNSYGLNGNKLFSANLASSGTGSTGTTNTGTGTGSGSSVASAVDGLDVKILDVVTTNNNTGILSSASLKAAIIAQIGQTAYDQLFAVSGYDLNRDGMISTADFGGGSFASLPANQSTVESFFFGTSIRALKAIDMEEIIGVTNFLSQNETQLAAGNASVMAAYFDLVYNMMIDPASPPLLTDQQIADSIIMGAVASAQVMDGQPITLAGIFSSDAFM
jgi:hypothetical protein